MQSGSDFIKGSRVKHGFLRYRDQQLPVGGRNRYTEIAKMLRTVCLSNVKWRRDLGIHDQLITGIAFPVSEILQLLAL